MALVKPISGVDDRVPLAEALPLSSPFTLNVFPTNACNFRCSYCAQGLGAKKLADTYGVDKSYMSMETLTKIVKQSKAFSSHYKLLSFMGHGEPLLNKDLPEMINMVTCAGIAKRIEIITNASLLTNEISDQLIKSGLTNLRVSLQGLNKDAYHRTSGVILDFECFVDRLSYFHRNKKPDMGLFVKIMDVSLGDGDEERFYGMFDSISDRMFVERVQQVYHAVKLDGESNSNSLIHNRYGYAQPPRKVCPLAFFSLAVWPNGDVYPCDAIYKPCKLGNVTEKPLIDMWQGDELRQFRMQLLHGKKDILSGCQHCCAPNDVSHPADVLDGCEEQIMVLL